MIFPGWYWRYWNFACYGSTFSNGLLATLCDSSAVADPGIGGRGMISSASHFTPLVPFLPLSGPLNPARRSRGAL